MREVEVNDLYEGAYLMCMGHHLERLEFDGHGRACFVIAGDGVQGNVDEFRCGRANSNIALYLFTLEKLKDQLFSELRKRG